MLFNSFSFLVFFPIVVILYFLLPNSLKKLFLFLASCIFYMFGTPLYILVIFLTIIIDYAAALIIARSKHYRKHFLILSIISNLTVLIVFKYFNFILGNIGSLSHIFGLSLGTSTFNVLLPIGLSFHTFQGMAYVIEVYKKKFKPEKNILTYALYVMFFPQLVAGPIERPQHLIPQFKVEKNFNYENVRKGLLLMMWGMFKKVAIADRLSIFVQPIYAHPQDYSGITLIIATVFFAFQIYYDFSGYIDIARGSAKVLGYQLVINFNNPYGASSIQEFWRRWNTSVSSWFRDYVYIPLGGNKNGTKRTIINILITFFLSGLWHGASWHYIIWGLINGVYLAIQLTIGNMPYFFSKPTARLLVVISPIVTFALVCFAWIFFRANTTADALYIVKKIFSFHEFSMPNSSIVSNFFLNQNIWEVSIVIILILVTEVIHHNALRTSQYILSRSVYVRWSIYILVLWTIILAGTFGETTFIYFAF